MPVDPEVNLNEYKAWHSGSGSGDGYGSNYFDRTRPSTKRNPIDIAAAAYQIFNVGYNSSTGARYARFDNGTSLAAPMVTATVGMMRKLNPNLTAVQLKEIVTYSANVRKFEEFSPFNTFVLGRNLEQSVTNNDFKAGIRDLNTYNALVIAKTLADPNNVAVVRVHNNDDAGIIDQAVSAFAYPTFFSVAWGHDSIFSLTSPGGNYVNYANYNESGGCTYGFQVYGNSIGVGDVIGGVVGTDEIPCNQGELSNNMSIDFTL